MTADAQRNRQLAWGDCLNVRDLGGHPTHDGRETAWRAVVRADSLSALGPDGCAAVEAYGVRTVIDLRLETELATAPNPFAGREDCGVAYANLSLIDPTAAPPPPYATLADDYKSILSRFPDPLSQILTAIARAPEGGVVVHCAGGRDRTGIVVALLLAIAAEYALSTEYRRPRDEAWLADGPGDSAEREQRYAWGITRAEVMLEFLTHLDRAHSGVEAYLLAIGVTAEDIARLRARLLS